MKAVLYVHGMGGNAAEADFYRPLFPRCDVVGLDYKTFTPWETGREIALALEDLKARHENVILIANSIGAYFSLHSGADKIIKEAYLISPVVDMERMILGMMASEGVTEEALEKAGVIPTPFGVELSWEYLSFVRRHPVKWSAPTHILYGEKDALVAFNTVERFASSSGADLTVMKGGEHWFHTEEQMKFLSRWIEKAN